MTEQEKAQVKETIKNDAALSKAYQQLLNAKAKGQLRRDIQPEEIMVTLVAKYGTNTAGLVSKSLSAPANVMQACGQSYAAASGTLQYLAGHDVTDKQLAQILNKSEAIVKKDRAKQGTQLPQNKKTALKHDEQQARLSQRTSTRQATSTQSSAKANTPAAATKAKATTTTKRTATPTTAATRTTTSQSRATSASLTPSWGNQKALKQKEQEQLYAACNPDLMTGQTNLRTLMEKGLVTQADIQAVYNKNGKEFVAGISTGSTGNKLAKQATQIAKGKTCKGGCLSGVMETYARCTVSSNPEEGGDVPWGGAPVWDKYKRPGQEANWACDTYKVLEEKGYITVTIPNSACNESRNSAGANLVRNTVASFPAGTTVSFDNKIDEQADKSQDFRGLIKSAPNESAKCGHVATVTKDGLCSDGFQSGNDGYDPSRYGKEIHFSLHPDTPVSEELAKQLIAEAQARRDREEKAKSNSPYLKQPTTYAWSR